MKNLIFLLIALGVGGLHSIQGAINSGLGKNVNHPLQASFISFLGALLFIVVMLAILRPEIPSLANLKSIPIINYTGGFYGVIFVTAVLILTPKIGIANTLVAATVGQLIVSVTMDHFGLLGLARQPINITRLLGCAGLIVSLLLLQKT